MRAILNRDCSLHFHNYSHYRHFNVYYTPQYSRQSLLRYRDHFASTRLSLTLFALRTQADTYRANQHYKSDPAQSGAIINHQHGCDQPGTGSNNQVSAGAGRITICQVSTSLLSVNHICQSAPGAATHSLPTSASIAGFIKFILLTNTDLAATTPPPFTGDTIALFRTDSATAVPHRDRDQIITALSYFSDSGSAWTVIHRHLSAVRYHRHRTATITLPPVNRQFASITIRFIQQSQQLMHYSPVRYAGVSNHTARWFRRNADNWAVHNQAIQAGTGGP